MIRVVRLPAMVAAVVAMSAHAVLACPSCSDNFTKGSANASIGEAYSWSVLFMLAVPLFIVTMFVVMMWRKHRAHSRA
jgi:uncharacterized membrane protein